MSKQQQNKTNRWNPNTTRRKTKEIEEKQGNIVYVTETLVLYWTVSVISLSTLNWYALAIHFSWLSRIQSMMLISMMHICTIELRITFYPSNLRKYYQCHFDFCVTLKDRSNINISILNSRFKSQLEKTTIISFGSKSR